MLLSIIVPVYNVEAYLRRCVDSLLGAEVSEYEIILVDDGSTDRSGEICDEYSRAYGHIKTVHKPNGGLSDARNAGLACAVGAYVLFVDSDDYLREGSVPELCERLAGCDADILCCNARSICGGEVTELCFSPAEGVLTGKDFLAHQYKCRTMQIAVWHNIYRRQMLCDGALYFKKGIYHEDEEWTPRVFLEAESVICVDAAYYMYVIRENSIMQQRDLSKHLEDMTSTLLALTERYRTELDGELFSLLKDRLVDRYLSIYAKGDFYKKDKRYAVSPSVLRGDLYFRKTRLKLLIYSFSKRLFCQFSHVYSFKNR